MSRHSEDEFAFCVSETATATRRAWGELFPERSRPDDDRDENRAGAAAARQGECENRATRNRFSVSDPALGRSGVGGSGLPGAWRTDSPIDDARPGSPAHHSRDGNATKKRCCSLRSSNRASTRLLCGNDSEQGRACLSLAGQHRGYCERRHDRERVGSPCGKRRSPRGAVRPTSCTATPRYAVFSSTREELFSRSNSRSSRSPPAAAARQRSRTARRPPGCYGPRRGRA